MLLDAAKSVLLVIDIQERLLPAMAAPKQVTGNTETLIRAADRLNIPILVSRQYPRGLGTIVPELALLVRSDQVVDKVAFSCIADAGFASRLAALDRSQAVVLGLETHVCVLQTALDLLAQDYDTFVVADATSSRKEASQALALRRLEAAGAAIVTTEMVVFEWLRVAATPEFKELSSLIK